MLLPFFRKYGHYLLLIKNSGFSTIDLLETWSLKNKFLHLPVCEFILIQLYGKVTCIKTKESLPLWNCLIYSQEPELPPNPIQLCATWCASEDLPPTAKMYSNFSNI